MWNPAIVIVYSPLLLMDLFFFNAERKGRYPFHARYQHYFHRVIYFQPRIFSLQEWLLIVTTKLVSKFEWKASLVKWSWSPHAKLNARALASVKFIIVKVEILFMLVNGTRILIFIGRQIGCNELISFYPGSNSNQVSYTLINVFGQLRYNFIAYHWVQFSLWVSKCKH